MDYQSPLFLSAFQRLQSNLQNWKAKKKGIILFGAGSDTKEISKKIDLQCFVKTIIDNNPSLSGKSLGGVKISPLSYLKPHHNNIIVICAFYQQSSIFSDLINFGVPRDNIYKMYSQSELERLEFLEGLPSDSISVDALPLANGASREVDLQLIYPACFDIRWPNIGLGYVAQSARSAGFNVSLYDINNTMLTRCKNNAERDYWQNCNNERWIQKDKYLYHLYNLFSSRLDECVEEILSTKARYIGIFMSRSTRLNGLDIAYRIKKRRGMKGQKIIVGGYDCHFERVANFHLKNTPYIDHVIIGDGEIIIPKILSDQYDSSKKFLHGESLENLDEYKWPTYQEVNWEIMYKKRVIIMGSRGCRWGRCNICPDRFGGRYRTRSGRNIFQEILFHYKQNGIREFSFADPILNGRQKVLEELCDLIENSDMQNLQFDGQMSIAYSLRKPLLARLKKIGFKYIIFGLESGSDKILKDMNKGFTVSRAETAIKQFHKVGIKVCLNLIVGFPTETIVDFEHTKNFLTRNKEFLYKIEENNRFYIYTHQADSGNNAVNENPRAFGVEDNSFSIDDWVSQNGALTLPERIRRLEEIDKLAMNLGLKRSYKKEGYEGLIT